MGIRYESLDKDVRCKMVLELERDQNNDTLYISPRLTQKGAKAWPLILNEAFNNHDDRWIASFLRGGNFIRETEERCNRNGREPSQPKSQIPPRILWQYGLYLVY